MSYKIVIDSCGELPETAQGMTLKRFGYSC